jgi:hypothetical protein
MAALGSGIHGGAAKVWFGRDGEPQTSFDVEGFHLSWTGAERDEIPKDWVLLMEPTELTLTCDVTAAQLNALKKATSPNRLRRSWRRRLRDLLTGRWLPTWIG